jgi:hypothetical protein
VRSQMALDFLHTLRPKVEVADSLISAASEAEEKENLLSEYDQVRSSRLPETECSP